MIVGKTKRNRDAENKGAWFQYDEDTRFLVARSNNTAYAAFIQAAYAENELVIDRKTKEADQLANKLMLEGFCRHILLGWEGVVDMENNPIPYSVDTAMTIMDEEDEVKAAIKAFADKRSNYLIAAEKKATETVKKS